MDMTIEQMLSNYATNASILGADAAKESFYSDLDALVASDEAMEVAGSLWGYIGDSFEDGGGRAVGGALLIIPAVIVTVIEIVLRLVGVILGIVIAIIGGVLMLPVLIIGLPIFAISAASEARKIQSTASSGYTGFEETKKRMEEFEKSKNSTIDSINKRREEFNKMMEEHDKSFNDKMNKLRDSIDGVSKESVGVAMESSTSKIKLNPTALSAAKSYQKSLNVMLKSSFETSQMISRQIESMKKGSDKLDDMQHKAESLKAVFSEVSKQKAAYDKAMQSVGATGKEKGLYWNREEVNNMKSLAKTIANESKRQQKFLEKFKAKCEKTLSAAKAAKAKGEKNMKLSPEMVNADKETVKMCNVYLSVVKLCQKSVEITKTALVDAGAKKDKTEDKSKKSK